MARAEVEWADPPEIPHIAAAMIEDHSRGGVCIRLKEHIGVGSKITIRWSREEFSGIVRHSKKVAGHYVVGVQRQDVASQSAAAPDNI